MKTLSRNTWKPHSINSLYQHLPSAIYSPLFIKSYQKSVLSLKFCIIETSLLQIQEFFKKGVLRNFTKFTGKHLCQSLFLIKLQALPLVVPRCSVKKGDLRNFAKFTGKHLCQSHSFNKVVGWGLLLKERLWHRCFPVNFVKFLRTRFLTDYLWWIWLRHAGEMLLDRRSQ